MTAVKNEIQRIIYCLLGCYRIDKKDKIAKEEALLQSMKEATLSIELLKERLLNIHGYNADTTYNNRIESNS